MPKMTSRVWIAEEKKMYYNVGYYFQRYKQKVVMRRSDVFDKNGKRVYEDDIVRYGGNVYVVEHDLCRSKFNLCQRNTPEVPFTKRIGKDLEILGNIFENQELGAQHPYLRMKRCTCADMAPEEVQKMPSVIFVPRLLKPHQGMKK